MSNELRSSLLDGKLTLIVGPGDKFGKHEVKAENCSRVLHVDQFNLTSAFLRGKFVAALDLAPSERQLVNNGLLQLAVKAKTLIRESVTTEEVSAIQADESPSEPPPEPGTPRYDKAMVLLKTESDLTAKAARDIRKLGHVGNYKSLQLGITCAGSALAGVPLHPVTSGQSSGGKSQFCKDVLSLVPPERVIKRSGLSPKALYRIRQSLKHKILMIEEAAGSEDADYSIRILQSDGGLQYEATEKDSNGKMENVVHVVEGPCSVFTTTTKQHQYHENETRILPIHLDETREQTERIVKRVLRDAAGRKIPGATRDAMLEVWHDAFRLLEDREVVIPFAKRLQVPVAALRVRRDIHKIIYTIQVIAWLHQYQRECDSFGRIIASEADFHKANALLGDSLAQAWKGMTPSEERLWEAIKQLPKEKRQAFNRSDLAPFCDMPARTMKACLSSLSEAGFLDCDYRKGRMGNRYQVAASLFADDSLDTFKITLAQLPIKDRTTQKPPVSTPIPTDSGWAEASLPISENPLPVSAHSRDEEVVDVEIHLEDLAVRMAGNRELDDADTSFDPAELEVAVS